MQKRVTIREDITATGQSLSAFVRFSKVSHLTLSRMEQGDPGILPQTWAKVERKFQEFLVHIGEPKRARATG
jgi:hypothetical protein